MSSAPTIFIDGESGTTGLGIRERLSVVPGLQLRSIEDENRKNLAAKKALLSEVDVVVLCLPDEAARETVAIADDLAASAPRIVDASTAHRVAEGWIFGFPELAPEQADAVRCAKRVANPGCYSTGGIALLRPLVDAGIMARDYPVSINAVSGYSGGGKGLIEKFESGAAPSFEIYGLGLEHKHLPELQKYTGLTRRPLFTPSVGNFKQGMLVSIPLHIDTLTGCASSADIEALLVERYRGSDFVRVATASEDYATKAGRISPDALNDTNCMELRVFGNDDRRHAVLMARLDNLGKGASGAAVQNIKLMLGLT
ncbi:MAG: N-acetyl-gamma-glutamyl-phosphate reductase [Hyphomicrobiaceae bacterium]